VAMAFVRVLECATVSTDGAAQIATVCCLFMMICFSETIKDRGDSSICPAQFRSACRGLGSSREAFCSPGQFIDIVELCGFYAFIASCQTTPAYYGGCCPGFTGSNCLSRKQEPLTRPLSTRCSKMWFVRARHLLCSWAVSL
jgi:hypothetical protein